MSAWDLRRFWTSASAVPTEGGYAVLLDGKPVKTPQKAALILPTLALAEAVAAEWQAVEGKVNPAAMPFTRTANSAIDKVAPQFDEVAAMLSAYGGSDLLCYRAEGPEALVARQARAWDPLLGWAATELGALLRATAGVVHVEQAPESLFRLHKLVCDLNPFELAAFHDLVALSGSLVLALAVCRRKLNAETAWRLSRLDEDWQIEAWGQDEEAAEMAEVKHQAFLQADRFFALCQAHVS